MFPGAGAGPRKKIPGAGGALKTKQAGSETSALSVATNIFAGKYSPTLYGIYFQVSLIIKSYYKNIEYLFPYLICFLPFNITAQ